MEFNRMCPICNKELIYKSITSYRKAIKDNSPCRSCGSKNGHIRENFQYNCSICGKTIHTKNKQDKNLICNSCSVKLANEKKYSSLSYKRICPICNKDIYYVNEHNMKLAEINNTICNSCKNKELAKNKNTQLKKSISMKKQNNPMYNKSVYDVWVKKYGEDIANKKLNEMKKKISSKMSGKNNPMYGKPSPIGSGNGWSGWYKGIYFRSILELSYLKYLMDNNISFENGEKLSHKIQYKLDNKVKNYFPDFYLKETQEIVEIKPYNLIGSKINLAKFEAGKKIYGDKFKVITDKDIVKLDFNEIKCMYNNNEIKFIKKYDDKFKKLFTNTL